MQSITGEEGGAPCGLSLSTILPVIVYMRTMSPEKRGTKGGEERQRRSEQREIAEMCPAL